MRPSPGKTEITGDLKDIIYSVSTDKLLYMNVLD